MKKKILIIVPMVLILATAAIVVGGRGGHVAPVDWPSKRGLDSYYAEEVLNYELKDISVNVKGTDAQRYLLVGIGVAYRIGPEIKDAKAPFLKAESDLRDRLTMLLSNKSLTDLEGNDMKNLLKQEILDQVGHAVFADKMGKVEQVFFRQFLIQ